MIDAGNQPVVDRLVVSLTAPSSEVALRIDLATADAYLRSPHSEIATHDVIPMELEGVALSR